MSFKKFLSYILPSVLELKNGALTDGLCVVYENGKHRLSAPNANYSYGGCSGVFSNVFQEIQFESYNFRSALILGLGAGGVVSLMGETYGKYPQITGIEGDPTVVELARKYFEIDRFTNLTIIEADAFEYAASCVDTYDLIIIDLFVNDIVPAVFHTREFIESLRAITEPASMVIFNKMTHTRALQAEVVLLAQEFERIFEHVRIVRTVVNDKENSMIVCNTLDPNPDAR